MQSDPLSPLTAVSPLDGRYRRSVVALAPYFSESALIHYRLKVEIEYFIALCQLPLGPLSAVGQEAFDRLRQIVVDFDLEDAARIKRIEHRTNHDVKAVEYFLKERFDDMDLGPWREWVHFGLTSQDINNTAMPMMLKDGWNQVLAPLLQQLVDLLKARARQWQAIPMLARTHGQPASPTRVGKELYVFVERLQRQLALIDGIDFLAKFGGATGNFNAHVAAYPDVDWIGFADRFVTKGLGLMRARFTTQIEPYDNVAAFLDGVKRINTILIDLSRDIWTYISQDYFKQKIKPGEVGSSTMPHKVNPIDFENAEGNLGIANALCEHLAGKLPISRLQRDLTDSTVTRSIGVPLGHTVIACRALMRGLNKLLLNPPAIEQDLDGNWAVVTEGIQTILRRESYPEPYEALKALTRGRDGDIGRRAIADFIQSLEISDEVKAELLKLTPANYIGVCDSYDHPRLALKTMDDQ